MSTNVIGISFPFRKANGQFPAVVTGTDAVKANIITLFNTPMRSRVMRPTFGTNVFELLFDSTGALLSTQIERSVMQTIFNFEPRINVISVDVTETNNMVAVTVNYEIHGVIESVEIINVVK